MNDIDFSKSFGFHIFEFKKFNYTDNRIGAPCHYFAYMISGSCKITTDSYTVEINEGDIFYIPNKCSYQSYWYAENDGKFVSLGFSYLPNFENKVYPVQVIEKNSETVELLLKLGNTKIMSAKHIGLFYTLTAMLLPKMYPTSFSRSDEIVEQTRNYLINHPYASVPEMAKNCAISEAALYLSFQKSSDITPNQLKNKILLEKAKDTVITTDRTIDSVSNSLGFSSTSYFRKKFKEYFGITPKEMRKQYRI